MKINKDGYELSATGKTNLVMSLASIGLVAFGLGVYLFSSKIVGGAIILPSAFVLIGVLSQIFTKIRMLPDRLEVVTLFSQRVFQKELLKRVSWEKGVGVSIQLADSSWVKIPDLGNSQSVCNSIRAWLKRA